MEELFFAPPPPGEKTHFLKKKWRKWFLRKIWKKNIIFLGIKKKNDFAKKNNFLQNISFWENLKKNYIFLLQKRNFFSYKNWRKRFFYLNKNKKSFSPRKIVQKKSFLKTILFCSKKNSWKIEENNFAQKNSKKQMNFLRKKHSENDLFFCI